MSEGLRYIPACVPEATHEPASTICNGSSQRLATSATFEEPESHCHSVSQKSTPPPKTFCDIFTCGEPVYLKITVAIAQTYSYIYINFGPFI